MNDTRKIKTTHTTTNSSDRYLLIADYHIVLGHFDSFELACNASNVIAPDNECDPLAATRYSVLEVLSPGETTSGKLEQTIIVEREATPEEIAATWDLFGVQQPE